MVDPSTVVTVASNIWNFLNTTEVQDLVKKIKDKIKEMKVLSYEQLMKFVVDGKPDDVRVVAAALLREKISNGKTRVSIIYLDKNNKPIFGDGNGLDYGFSLSVEQMDAEVADLFGNLDLILLT